MEPLRGPWPELVELGRPTTTSSVPSASERPTRTESLGAVVVAAGEGVVAAVVGVGAVIAQLVLVGGLLVPVLVVEIRVVVGDLGPVEPVDGDAHAGGAGVVAGVDVGGAADDGEAVAVGLDVGVAGRGAGLDEGVVGRDVGGRAVALGRGEEDQPELVAGGQPGGDQAPVTGDLGGADAGGARYLELEKGAACRPGICVVVSKEPGIGNVPLGIAVAVRSG